MQEILLFISELLKNSGEVFATISAAWDSICDVLYALLAVLGGLKVVARYTRCKWDDRLVSAVEAPVMWLIRKVGRRREKP